MSVPRLHHEGHQLQGRRQAGPGPPPQVVGPLPVPAEPHPPQGHAPDRDRHECRDRPPLHDDHRQQGSAAGDEHRLYEPQRYVLQRRQDVPFELVEVEVQLPHPLGEPRFEERGETPDQRLEQRKQPLPAVGPPLEFPGTESLRRRRCGSNPTASAASQPASPPKHADATISAVMSEGLLRPDTSVRGQSTTARSQKAHRTAT